MPDAISGTAGLCANCLHARSVQSARGSTFVLCARSQHDRLYPKYPRLPVVRCAGYEENAGSLETRRRE
jgi:hypothetical protein